MHQSCKCKTIILCLLYIHICVYQLIGVFPNLWFRHFIISTDFKAHGAHAGKLKTSCRDPRRWLISFLVFVWMWCVPWTYYREVPETRTHIHSYIFPRSRAIYIYIYVVSPSSHLKKNTIINSYIIFRDAGTTTLYEFWKERNSYPFRKQENIHYILQKKVNSLFWKHKTKKHIYIYIGSGKNHISFCPEHFVNITNIYELNKNKLICFVLSYKKTINVLILEKKRNLFFV